MKKHPIFIAVLSAFIVLSAFVGCSDQVVFPLSVVSAEIIQEKDMLVGQDFDASNFIVRVTYNNGSPKDLRGIVNFDGTTVTNGAEISANAGRDMYGEDYYVYGYINAYELTGLEVTGPATINTDSQNSVTVKAEDLTVNAKYAVRGETRTMKLAPVADYDVLSATIDDGATLDTSKTDAPATVTVKTTFQTDSDYATADYAFTAHYTGSTAPVEPGDYVWYKNTLAYSIADGAYFNRGLFGDGTDIVTIYKVMAPEGATTLVSDYQLEAIEDTDNLTLTLADPLEGTTGDETRFSADADSVAVTVSYRYIDNEANKYEYATQIVGYVEDGVLVRGSSISIPLYDDYLKDLTITLANPEKAYYVGDTLTYEDFNVYPVWASGINADTKLVLSVDYDFADKTAALDTPITFTYSKDDNAWKDYADGINSKTFELDVLDFPTSVTLALNPDVIPYVGMKVTADMIEIADVEWKSGLVYEDEAPSLTVALQSGYEDMEFSKDALDGAGRQNIYATWSCNGKSGNAPFLVTPVDDYPASIEVTQVKDIFRGWFYTDAYFEYDIVWKSGLVYGEEGTTSATEPTVTYSYDPANAGDAGVPQDVTITWTCNEQSDEIGINVTPIAPAGE